MQITQHKSVWSLQTKNSLFKLLDGVQPTLFNSLQNLQGLWENGHILINETL